MSAPEPKGGVLVQVMILMVGGVGGFLGGAWMPRKPTVMTQFVPQVCSSTISVPAAPTPESCELVRDMTGGHKAPVVEHDPESLIPAIVGTWRSIDGSVTVVVDLPWQGNKKKPPYHLRLILPNDPPDRGFGCDFMIEGTVMQSDGPLVNMIQYRAWCRYHQDARVAFDLGQGELQFALQLEGATKVTATKLVRVP